MTIRYIDIVHHSHADFGFTDHPLRARELQKKYVGEAIDLVLESKNEKVPFVWTCEVFLPVLDWWEEADETARSRLLEAVETGNFDVGGLPVNITAFLNKDEWDYIAGWLPAELREAWRISSAMQNDVNGLHTAGLQKMMDIGVENIWIGPNTYFALPPLPTPHAFNWEMPDGRRLFTWINASYCDGFFLFNKNWRQGPVPDSTDLRYRPPGAGDILKTDDASMEKAYELCKANIALIEGSAPGGDELERDGFTQNKIYGDYPYETLCVSFTNQWRIDNDPPFPSLCPFVEKWNATGLQPALRLSTASQALARMKEENKNRIPLYRGEWPDWWANGAAASPVELSATRNAKRILTAAKSPVFGDWRRDDDSLSNSALYNLCMYDEHTFGSWSSVSRPYGIESRTGKAEKDVYAYRGLDFARALIAARAGGVAGSENEGISIINPSKYSYNGYVEFPAHCLRGSYSCLADGEKRIKIEYGPGFGNFRRPESQADLGDEDDTRTFMGALENGNIKVWVELAPESVTRYLPVKEEAGESGNNNNKYTETPLSLNVETDDNGWPVKIGFDNLATGGCSELKGEFGDFYSITCEEFAPRWFFREIFDAEPSGQRKEMSDKYLKRIAARSYSKTQVTDNDYLRIYTQYFSHPAVIRAKRVLEVSKAEKKALLSIKINRRSSPEPEILYTTIKTAPGNIDPVITNAGGAFVPGKDQIPGSCMDYYAIDGTVVYRRGDDVWQTGSRDSAVVSFGDLKISQRIDRLPEEKNRAVFMLFNNTWDTNFAADEHGAMEFVFDLLCGCLPADAAEYAAVEPVVVINLREDTGGGNG